MGVVYEEMDEPDKAITYYKKSQEYLEEFGEQPVYLGHVYNNIGVLYREQENQPQAFSYFEKALRIPNLKSSDLSLYARLIDNRAYSRLLAEDTIGLSKEFHKSLRLRDSLQNQSGVIMSKLHLAQYHAYQQDTTKAIVFAKDALYLARAIRNNRDILKSLLLLSNLNKPISNTYLQEYIGLSKVIRLQERKTRDKFTRVQYETDRYVERNKQLSSQKLWILIIAIGLLLVLSFFYIFHRQRAKNRMLYLETRRQKANEQLYLLTLKHHERLQKGLNQQRERISEELHDAILGELFAIRMNWGLLPLQGRPEIVKEHQEYLEALQRIEKQIRKASHNLMQNLMAFPLNFIQMVENLVQRRCKPLPITCKVHNDESIPWEKVDLMIQINLYRIIEEGLQNCIRHARATHVDIRFTRKGQALTLTIRDDGQGFNPRKGTKGIGLIHIRSRVQKFGGNFWVNSGKGQGTTLTISIPVFKTVNDEDNRQQ
ncbi:ATP-binding protein [Sinomicrobium oceani]|uniref:ATP-binding protein n=1 Tax=Sinomicrobium oceani TaxID=1150368 RepID=UPI00227A2C6E|nr:sensor histidine kinase [Sinomicrobium oceani]